MKSRLFFILLHLYPAVSSNNKIFVKKVKRVKNILALGLKFMPVFTVFIMPYYERAILPYYRLCVCCACSNSTN